MKNSNKYSVAMIIAGLLLIQGCASQTPTPHITRPDVPRVAVRRSERPQLSEEEVMEQHRSRFERLQQENVAAPLELDAYGGWVNAPESLGESRPDDYFRMAKLDGAWWFITPDGHPYVSKGVTDVHWLGASLSGGIYHEIIVDKYGDEDTWADAAQHRAQEWGFNSIGPWSSRSIAQRMAHAIIILDSAGHAPRHPDTVVTDYWSPEFFANSATVAEQRAAPFVEDKNLIGYFLDNEIVWDADHFLTNQTMLQLYLAFPEDAPGRNEAIRFLRQSSETVEEFNAIWNTDIAGWSDIAALTPRDIKPGNETADALTLEFALMAFHQYATIAIEALRRVDPNHLILGCRFHNYPGDALIRAAAEHFDVISMAFYEARPPFEEIDAIYREVDIPFLIGEWTFKSDDSGILNPFGIYAPEVATEKERSLAYDNYVETFMRRPYAVGYHWYKWMDNPVVSDQRFTGDNCGLINQNDEPYAGFVTFISQVNRRVEAWHAEGVTSETP